MPVKGSFVGDSGLSSYKVRILQGTNDKSDLFSITSQPVQLDGSQTAWDLAVNARLTLQVKTGIAGSYTLEVSISDPRGRSDTSRAVFSVLPPPDKTGPSIEWVSPISNLILENDDSVVAIEIKVSDPSGIDSVWVGGKKAVKNDSSWISEIEVAASDLGYELKVRAWDKAGNWTDSTRRIVRKLPPVAGAPVLRLLIPDTNAGIVLPFDSAILRLQWSITDPTGLDSTSISVSGEFKFWGHDTSGLGTLPTLGAKIKSLPAGSYHQIARLEDGTVKAWGRNFSGQCNVPTDLKKVKQVSVGWYFGVVLQEDSTVRFLGDTSYGQHRISDTLKQVIAIAAGSAHTIALRADGLVFGWGGSGANAEVIPERLSDVVAVAARARVSLALRKNGTVAAWGDNFYGQLNVPDGMIDIVTIGVGAKHAVAMTKDGNVYC